MCLTHRTIEKDPRLGSPVSTSKGRATDRPFYRQLQEIWGAPKSLQMVIVAMKLKDAYSLERKL